MVRTETETEELIDEIHQMRRDNWTVISIARRLDKSYTTIRRILKIHPLPVEDKEIVRPKPAVHWSLTQPWGR